MIVDELDIVGVAVLPAEAKTKLVVHPNAVLPSPASRERLQSIPGRYAEILKTHRGVEYEHLTMALPL